MSLPKPIGCRLIGSLLTGTSRQGKAVTAGFLRIHSPGLLLTISRWPPGPSGCPLPGAGLALPSGVFRSLLRLRPPASPPFPAPPRRRCRLHRYMAPAPSSRGAPTARASCHRGRPPVPGLAVAPPPPTPLPEPGAAAATTAASTGLEAAMTSVLRHRLSAGRGRHSYQVACEWKPEEGKEGSERASTLGSKSVRQERARGHRKPEACRASPGHPSFPFLTVEREQEGKSLPGCRTREEVGVRWAFWAAPSLSFHPAAVCKTNFCGLGPPVVADVVRYFGLQERRAEGPRA